MNFCSRTPVSKMGTLLLKIPTVWTLTESVNFPLQPAFALWGRSLGQKLHLMPNFHVNEVLKTWAPQSRSWISLPWRCIWNTGISSSGGCCFSPSDLSTIAKSISWKLSEYPIQRPFSFNSLSPTLVLLDRWNWQVSLIFKLKCQEHPKLPAHPSRY